MIQTTYWSLDTCGCKLHFQWDDALDGNNRVHTYISVMEAQNRSNIKRDLNGIPRKAQPNEVLCPAHSHLTATALFNSISEENVRKNMVEAIGVGLGLDSEEYSWTFDENRVLQVQFGTLTQGVRRDFQSAADIQFGPGKVVVS